MKAAKKTSEWESILRQAIAKSGLTNYELSKLSGVSEAQLSRFMNGKRTLTIPTAEKIAEHIGVEIKKREVKNGKSK